MTPIYCTHKMIAQIGYMPQLRNAVAAENKLGGWNAHIFLASDILHFIFVHNTSYYTVVIQHDSEEHIDNLESFFLNRLVEQLIYDEVIDPADALTLRIHLLPVFFTGTNNDRKTIGTMNDFILNYQACFDVWDDDGSDVKLLNSHLNQTLSGAGKTKDRAYGNRIKDMKDLLAKL